MNYSCNYNLVTSDICANDGTISVWDGHTGVNLLTLSGQKVAKNSIAIINDTIISCVDNKSLLELWQISKEGKKKVIALPAPAKAMKYYEPLNILTCFLGFDIYIFQPETGKLLAILDKVHSHPGSEILFTTLNVISVDESGLIVCWHISMNEFCDVLWKTRPFKMEKIHCALIEELNYLYVASENGRFIILSLTDGKPICELTDLSLNIRSVLRHKDRIFIGCSKGTLVIYSIRQRTVIRRLIVRESTDADHAITNLSLTPDNKYIVLCIDHSTVVTISNIEQETTMRRPFTIGQNVNNMVAIYKSDDAFTGDQTNNSNGKFAIKKLNFSLDDPSAKNIDIHLGSMEPDMTAQTIVDSLDSSCYDIFSRMRASTDKNELIEKQKLRNVQKNLFFALTK